MWIRRLEVLGATLTALAAIGALFLTQQQSHEQDARTKEGQITDRYTAAVVNLGDQSVEVRLGGIYALQRIMKDSPRDQPSVVDVLSAYVRTHARSAGKASTGYAGRPEPDVQAAFEVLARRAPQYDDRATVDLREAYLPHIGVRSPDGPDSRRSHTDPAHLPHANLSGANLREANLARADLRSTYLVGADLSQAALSSADLGRARILDAALDHAWLERTHMEDASLVDVSLQKADLKGADLRGADLRGADFEGADLSGADLRGAYLRDAPTRTVDGKQSPWFSRKLTRISEQQLLSARIDQHTTLPTSLADSPTLKKQAAMAPR
ncbi:pentapeptide repeat-containing protein [Streptomyces chrestomyceticus]|uniref:pentapeptide repeat-containing protein n=1 Tax=Streptomyces chrestomyceticus TaxID=68185 RepID=UPI00368191A7